ncbi:hypothetical protein PoB_007417100 [Plakobranchus ocellatus]|uniref:Uncharacterized protein n=1 Tax=Plakobranchus ocellatus TaxID=259542 RepID=A0AAV4DUS6_9GAST|nr:hypothetical protein PoB_007417100 [Plakobranchus ocellatus]
MKIAKKILSQPEPYTALLDYRATAHSSIGTSPARVLMGRDMKTRAPVLPGVLQPNPLREADVRAADEKTKRAYKLNYDRKHGKVGPPSAENRRSSISQFYSWGKTPRLFGIFTRSRPWIVIQLHQRGDGP